MESLSPEQQQKRNRAEEINQGIQNGTITDVSDLDPRDTSIEFIQGSKQKLRALGYGAIRRSSGL